MFKINNDQKKVKAYLVKFFLLKKELWGKSNLS